MSENNYDAIIIGAGLGGMLSAAQLLQLGKRVLLVERLPHCGGRFTARTFQGAQVSTGAVHMIPFGSSGVLASMLRSLRVPHHFFDADVFASFHVRGKQIRARGILGTFKVFGPRQFFWFLRVGCLMFFHHLPAGERAMPFDEWLAHHIDVRRNPELRAFFERISRFAFSLELSQVSTEEVIRTTKNMFRFGAPGIVQGGCGALTAELQRSLTELGAEVRLLCVAQQILHEENHVTGVRVRDKLGGEETTLYAPLVISDLGPRATDALLNNRRITQADVLKQSGTVGTRFIASASPSTASTIAGADADTRMDAIHRVPLEFHEAIGLKVHILSDVSLIPHKGIMYCLDTQRIAGMVQPTNSDPRLAPPGKHLLISHQVMQSNDVDEEKALALADLRMLFGEAFAKHCRILTMSAYRGEWPVNRIAQGEDLAPRADVEGLYLVGDAVKPPGYLMVEGVAQSVNTLLDLLSDVEQDNIAGEAKSGRPRYVAPPPSRLNALRWLWEAPGNSRKH